MKQTIFFLSVCALLLTSSALSGGNGYKMTVYADNMEGEQLYLYHWEENTKVIDSATVKKGKAIFKGTLPEPMYKWLEFPGCSFGERLFLENNEIIVRYDTCQALTVSGSDSHAYYLEYLSHKANYDSLKTDLLAQYQSSEQSPMDRLVYVQEYEQLQKRELEQHLHFLRRLSDSAIIVHAGLWESNPNYGQQSLKTIYDIVKPMAEKYPAAGRQFMDHYNAISKMATGMKAPGFTINNPEGQPVSLSYYSGKWVLLDFWSSWCVPCRQKHPEMVEFYQGLDKDKAEIIGISMDADMGKWKAAIEKDALPWPNVSELREWMSTDIADDYEISALPTYLLINPDGDIAYRGTVGQETSMSYLKIRLQHELERE